MKRLEQAEQKLGACQENANVLFSQPDQTNITDFNNNGEEFLSTTKEDTWDSRCTSGFCAIGVAMTAGHLLSYFNGTTIGNNRHFIRFLQVATG